MVAPWYNDAWRHRKKITAAASGTPGDLVGFPVHYAERSDIPILGRSDGYDLLVTAADGVTKIPHLLKAWERMLTANGVWTWFCAPSAIYYNGKVYAGWIDDDANIIVASVDVSTGAYVQTTLHTDINGGEADDHNNPSLLILADGKVFVAYTGHGSASMYTRLSANAEDVSSFEDEVAITETGLKYVYTHPVQFEDGTIRLFYRNTDTTNGIANERELRYIDSDDGGQTWGTSVALFIEGSGGSNRPYFRMFWATDQPDRVDFCVSLVPPGEDSGSPYVSDIHHFYMVHGESSDAYYESDGGTISVDLGVAPMDPSDLTSDSRIWDASAGSIRAWIWDIKRDSGTDDVAVLFATFETDAPDTAVLNHLLQHAYKDVTPDTPWAITEIGRMGQPLVYAGITGGSADKGPQPYYSGGACFSHASTADLWDVWASVEDGGHRRIKRYTSASADGSDWSATDPIPGVQGRKAFRPTGIRNYGGMSLDIPILWCVGPYANFEDDYAGTGIACDPALAQTGHVELVAKGDLSASEDTEFYLYFGNAGASDQQDAGNVFDADTVLAAYGNLDRVPLDGISTALAAESDVTIEVVFDIREPGISSAQTILSDWTAAPADGRKILIQRVSGGTITGYLATGTATTATMTGSETPTADAKHYAAVVLNDADNKSYLRIDGVDDAEVAVTLSANANTGTTPLWPGTTPHRHSDANRLGDQLAGIVYAVIVSTTARSTDWTTTQFNMLADPENFWTASAMQRRPAGFKRQNLVAPPGRGVF